MDAGSVCEGYLVKFTEIVENRTTIKRYRHLLSIWVDVVDVANVAVKDFLVVIVVGLHNFIARTIGVAEPFDRWAVLIEVERCL